MFELIESLALLVTAFNVLWLMRRIKRLEQIIFRGSVDF